MRGEVPDDVGSVTTPEGDETLITVGTREAVNNTLVGLRETTLLDLQARTRSSEQSGSAEVKWKIAPTISSWFCTKSLIRSIGAADVFATA